MKVDIHLILTLVVVSVIVLVSINFMIGIVDYQVCSKKCYPNNYEISLGNCVCDLTKVIK